MGFVEKQAYAKQNMQIYAEKGLKRLAEKKV